MTKVDTQKHFKSGRHPCNGTVLKKDTPSRGSKRDKYGVNIACLPGRGWWMSSSRPIRSVGREAAWHGQLPSLLAGNTRGARTECTSPISQEVSEFRLRIEIFPAIRLCLVAEEPTGAKRLSGDTGK
jgi:hypothetical protein